MATSGYFYMATNGDFLMAMDSTGGLARRLRLIASALPQDGDPPKQQSPLKDTKWEG